MYSKPFSNSVSRLRQQCVAQSRRPFQARGASITRCESCLLSQDWCACHHRPLADPSCAAAIIFYQGEIFKPSNSGRLIADTIADNHAFLWRRTEIDPNYQALINNPKYQPLVVFPAEYAESDRLVNQLVDYQQLTQQKIPLFIFLDGTWREARKMFRSRWFADLPVISLFESQQINYQLRQSAHDFQLGTADVAIHLFQQLGHQQLAQNLGQYAKVMQTYYLAGKANLRPEKTDSGGYADNSALAGYNRRVYVLKRSNRYG